MLNVMLVSDYIITHLLLFAGATFTGATFTGATFTGAIFTGAIFTGAIFTGATFTGATFTGAIFAPVTTGNLTDTTFITTRKHCKIITFSFILSTTLDDNFLVQILINYLVSFANPSEISFFVLVHVLERIQTKAQILGYFNHLVLPK